MIFTDATPTTSDVVAVIVTGTIFLFGGQIEFGEAVTLLIAGAVVSRTVIVNDPLLLFPAASVAVTVTVVVPIGNVLPGATL
jgi:archaellum component FlaF (FlaF/FlaG flagellin family)